MHVVTTYVIKLISVVLVPLQAGVTKSAFKIATCIKQNIYTI